jgi:transcriptional regulator with XRE-family HTH domain
MTVRLGQRLRAIRELMGMTQEKVIERLELEHNIMMSQQTLSCIENGKRRIDAEKELPALAYIYGKPIDYFYQSYDNIINSKETTPIENESNITINLNILTQKDKLQLIIMLVNDLIESTP